MQKTSDYHSLFIFQRIGCGRGILGAFAVVLMLLFPFIGFAQTNTYPRLANYYLTGQITTDEARQLAKWDVVVMGYEIPVTSPAAFALIKQLNPSIILLGYIDSIMKHGSDPMVEPLHTQYLGTKDEWLLRSPEGTPMSFWPGTKIVNPTDYIPLVGGKRWNDFLPEFTVSTLNTQQGWDGIFFDDGMPDIAWLNYGNIDINMDGVKDSSIFIDDAWRGGMYKMFGNARTLAGPHRVIVTNSSNIYGDHTNGRMFENYFTDRSNWVSQINEVNEAVVNGGYAPRYVLINANTENSGNWQDWQKFRYAYASSLMTDAYFSYDHGDAWHQQLWWYDEYDAHLGAPLDAAHVLTGVPGSTLGVWRRDFEQGIALINTTGVVQQIDLHALYWKLNGTQDPRHNDGTLVNNVSLSPYDGIVLMRDTPQPIPSPSPTPQPQPETDAAMPRQAILAGNTAEVYSSTDGTSQRSWELRSPDLTPGAFGLTDDLDRDGHNEVITYHRGTLTARRNSATVWTMRPYENAWSGRVSMFTGDVDGDGTREIVVVAGEGGGPHVRIVGADGRLKGNGFFAGDPANRGGAYLALADLDQDAMDDIIIGSGKGASPTVSWYRADGSLSRTFQVFTPAYRGGVSVAAGDMDGDGDIEIIAAPAGTGAGNIFIYDPFGNLLTSLPLPASSMGNGARIMWWNVPPYQIQTGTFLIDRGPLLNYSPHAPTLGIVG